MTLKTHYMTRKNDLPSVVRAMDDLGGKVLREIVVERVCLTCDYTCYARSYKAFPWVFNMRTRIMHIAGEDADTLCGKDATGMAWLWQL